MIAGSFAFELVSSWFLTGVEGKSWWAGGFERFCVLFGTCAFRNVCFSERFCLGGRGSARKCDQPSSPSLFSFSLHAPTPFPSNSLSHNVWSYRYDYWNLFPGGWSSCQRILLKTFALTHAPGLTYLVSLFAFWRGELRVATLWFL